jgi:hypothetical protein
MATILNYMLFLGNIGTSEILVLLTIVICLIFYIQRRRKVKENKKNNLQCNSNNIINNDRVSIIPDTYPHCKSPNTKKLRECEWCGNRIY